MCLGREDKIGYLVFGHNNRQTHGKKKRVKRGKQNKKEMHQFYQASTTCKHSGFFFEKNKNSNL